MSSINKRAEIPKLLGKLVFLSDGIRQRLLDEYQSVSEEKVEKIYNFLIQAIKNQQKTIEEEIAKNPQLLIDAKREVANTEMMKIHEKEDLSRKKELQALEEIENELNNIIIQ